jgi:hypothetical protein
MDKYFLDKSGKAEEYIQGFKPRKQVHFPLCLAVKYGNNVLLECANFLLNTSKRKVFIETDRPLPKGSDVMLHFYIPPEAKLLSEFKGKVIEQRSYVPETSGFFVKIRDFTHRRLKKLEEYLEEKRHLVDEEV